MSDTTTVRVVNDEITTVIATGTIGPPGPQGEAGPPGPTGPASTAVNQIIFSKDGELAVETGNSRYRVITDQVVHGVYISVGTAPVGDDLIVDVNVNGSTIFSSPPTRPLILDGENTSELAIPTITALTEGDYITVDVAQVGSTTPGSDLTVQILFE